MKRLLLTAFTAAALSALPASGAVIYFEVSLNGAQEVGGGDPDGGGKAKLWLNSATNMITWDITVSNIAFPLTGAHIHNAVKGVNGPVVINFNSTLMGSTTDADVANVIANPWAYYVNLHNATYPGGAIRGQVVPEPATWTMILGGLGLAGVLRKRMRKS